MRVPGLDGTGKMGKSDNNTIDLSDSCKKVEEKIKIAVTDPNRKRRKDPGDPSVCNIYTLHTMVSPDEIIKLVYKGCQNASIGCIDCKQALSENISSLLLPIQEKRKQLEEEKMQLVSEILHEGGKKARKVIVATVEEVKNAIGTPFY